MKLSKVKRRLLLFSLVSVLTVNVSIIPFVEWRGVSRLWNLFGLSTEIYWKVKAARCSRNLPLISISSCIFHFNFIAVAVHIRVTILRVEGSAFWLCWYLWFAHDIAGVLLGPIMMIWLLEIVCTSIIALVRMDGAKLNVIMYAGELSWIEASFLCLFFVVIAWMTRSNIVFSFQVHCDSVSCWLAVLFGFWRRKLFPCRSLLASFSNYEISIINCVRKRWGGNIRICEEIRLIFNLFSSLVGAKKKIYRSTVNHKSDNNKHVQVNIETSLLRDSKTTKSLRFPLTGDDEN